MTHARYAEASDRAGEPHAVMASSSAENAAINCSPAELLEALTPDLLTTLSLLKAASPDEIDDTLQLLGTGSRAILESMDAIASSNEPQLRTPVLRAQPLLYSLIEAAPASQQSPSSLSDIIEQLDGFANTLATARAAAQGDAVKQAGTPALTHEGPHRR